MPITHEFVSAKSDGGDTTELQPSDWNAPHVLVPVGCFLSNSGAQAIVTSTLTPLTFDTEAFDTDAFHDTGSNTSRITIPTGLGGWYLFGASWRIQSSATGYRRGGFKIDGSTFLVLDSRGAVSGESTDVTISRLIELSAGQYLEAWVEHTVGSNRNATDQVFWCEYRGPA